MSPVDVLVTTEETWEHAGPDAAAHECLRVVVSWPQADGPAVWSMLFGSALDVSAESIAVHARLYGVANVQPEVVALIEQAVAAHTTTTARGDA